MTFLELNKDEIFSNTGVIITKIFLKESSESIQRKYVCELGRVIYPYLVWFSSFRKWNFLRAPHYCCYCYRSVLRMILFPFFKQGIFWTQAKSTVVIYHTWLKLIYLQNWKIKVLFQTWNIPSHFHFVSS